MSSTMSVRGRGGSGAGRGGRGRCSPLPWRPPPSNQLQKYVRAITSIRWPIAPPAAHCKCSIARVTECAARALAMAAVWHRRTRRHYTHLGSEEKMYRAQVSTLLRLTSRLDTSFDANINWNEPNKMATATFLHSIHLNILCLLCQD